MDSTFPAPQVVVRGEATLLVDAEIAEVGVTVSGRARDRQSALERCRARQDEVAAVIAAAGGAVETVETTGLSVYREVRSGGREGDHVATVRTELTVGRLDELGDLVVALGRLDDVTVAGPWWRLRRDSPAMEQARLAAVGDAVHRARQYAAAFGAQLTALVEVADAGLAGSGVRVAEAMASMAPSGGTERPLDLAPARQEVHGAVEVRFAMSRPDPEVFRP